ncbi:MAG: hypothetical protein RLZZ96_1843 [Bacteroidota bacterium]|jgi:hypothetical protein
MKKGAISAFFHVFEKLSLLSTLYSLLSTLLSPLIKKRRKPLFINDALHPLRARGRERFLLEWLL